MNRARLLFVIAMCWALAGCAVHYSDSSTGAEHVWGFGHMVMKATVANEGKKAIVRGVSLLGVGLGLEEGSPFLILGWEERQRVDIVDENTTICLDGPHNDFLRLRVGSEFPSADHPAKEQQ